MKNVLGAISLLALATSLYFQKYDVAICVVLLVLSIGLIKKLVHLGIVVIAINVLYVSGALKAMLSLLGVM